VGHHFLGRTASVNPQTVHVSWSQTGRPPALRFARDCASQAGGFASSSANSASDIDFGRP